MKRMYQVLLILTVRIFPTAPQPEKFPLPPEIELNKLRLKKRALEQATEVIRSSDKCKCIGYTGKKLVACMDYADKEEVRLTFSHLSLHARIAYLLKMNLFEYKRFLDAFEHEDQWKESLAHLLPDEQLLLPQTIHEQRVMIRDTWISCAPRKVGVYAKGSADPRAHDIAAWQNKTLKDYEYMKKSCPAFLRWLKERFMEQKCKMLQDLQKKAIAESKE